MKVCSYGGYTIAVLVRDEHCPPHVHVDGKDWDARFKFTYWNNDVQLWDVTPEQNTPSRTVLENLRQTLLQPAHLQKARKHYWSAVNKVCLTNQTWDLARQIVIENRVSTKLRPIHPSDWKVITGSRFDASSYCTVLQLAGETEPLEIEL